MSKRNRTPKRALEAAIDHAGNQSVLARGIGCTPQLISRWVNGERTITAERAIAVERFTKGEVLAHELRPDVFPEARALTSEAEEAGAKSPRKVAS